MSQWKNNDREDSKPSWLTPLQKRMAIRTQAGWEIPLFLNKGFSGGLSSGTWYPTELIVCMPLNIALDAQFTSRNTFLSPTGGTARGNSAETRDAPYFCLPLTGDSPTAGGPLGLGYAELNASAGVTNFIRLIAQSANTTRNAVLGLLTFSGPFTPAGLQTGFTGWSLITSATAAYAALGATRAASFTNGFSGYSGAGIAALRLGSSSLSGTYSTLMRVSDGTLTGSILFTVRLV